MIKYLMSYQRKYDEFYNLSDIDKIIMQNCSYGIQITRKLEKYMNKNERKY